jgi:Mechanosensitive ion channel.
LNALAWLIPELTQPEWVAHGFIFAVNIGLLLFAKPILSLVDADEENRITLRIFRSVNLIILILHLLDIALLRVNDHYQNAFIKIGLNLAAVYTALYCYKLLCYLSRRRFGNEKTIDEKITFLDTYSSRLVDLLSLIFIVITLIYTLIKIWGANGLLETTGIFGIIAAFFAFTSNAWAPDIISGLIVLNSRILEDGDVVVVDGYPDEYIISKVSLIYIVLYDVRNNHRTLIRNSQFIKSKIDNLSRVASTDGLRKSITYKIGYPALPVNDQEQRVDQLNRYKSRIDRIFTSAFDNCCANKSVMINRDREFEWALTSTGDFALHYTLWVFLERIPNTKVTSSVRKHLIRSLFHVNEAVFTAAEIEGVSLSTPILNEVNFEHTEKDR